VAGVERGVVRLADDAAGRVHHGVRLGELGEVAEVVHRRVASDITFAEERRPVDRTEGHRVAADVHVVLGVARVDVELLRRLGDLLEDEVGVEEDGVLLDALSRLAEQLERAFGHELDADLGHDPPPTRVELRHRVGGEHLVARHRVAEHPSS
jgi:hypothetical protein